MCNHIEKGLPKFHQKQLFCTFSQLTTGLCVVKNIIIKEAK